MQGEGSPMTQPPDSRSVDAQAEAKAQARCAAFMARMSPMDDVRLKLDTYEATIAPVDLSKRPELHELTVSVFWPHRADDLDFFLSLGQGYLALDAIGRPLGSAMYFNMGDDFAMFGMMVTTPRLQALGAGQRLLRRIMRDCSGRDLRLSATRSGYRLYEMAGFTPVATIWQQQGVVRSFHLPEAVPGLAVREIEAGDLMRIKALDRHAYGADRGRVLDGLLDVSSGLVVERAGEVHGYALMRKFGKGVVIGPVVAEDDAMAMHLVAPLIQRCQGMFARLDTPQQSEHFKAFLAAAGMGVHDTVTEMRIGPARRAQSGALLYGLASHSLG